MFNGILHLTVSDKGLIRLHETPSEARSAKRPDEVLAQLSLTAAQMRTVIKAEAAAKQVVSSK